MTNLFVCVDSDDELMPDAVKKILEANPRAADKAVLGFYFRTAVSYTHLDVYKRQVQYYAV